MVLSSEAYYADKKVLFKPINATIRNQQRLKNTHPRDTLNELIKNAFEHGNGIVNIQFFPPPEAKLIIFNSMDQISLKELTFNRIISKLTTFQETSDSNFHEGLTTLLLFHARIRSRDFFIQNKRSEDGFFQYIEDASHFINDQGESIPFEDTKKTKEKSLTGWEVTIFDATAELFELVQECLNNFYCVKPFKLDFRINGTPYQLKPFECPRSYKMVNIYGLLNYSLDFTINDDARVDIYWRLKNLKIMQKVPNLQFNHHNVQGTVVLTDIHQFANEHRVELAHCVNQFIEDTVQGIQNIHLTDRVIKQYLIQYEQYKADFLQYLCELFGITEKALRPLFIDNKQEQTLLKISEFIFTINELLKGYKEYEKKLPKLFHHPQKELKMLGESAFHEQLRRINITLKQFREKFPQIPIGLKILNGDPEGFLFIGDLSDFLYGQKILHIIDPRVYFQDLLKFNNTQGILYPTNMHILYFIDDIAYKYIRTAAEFQEHIVISPEKLESLNDFAIGQNKMVQNLSPISPIIESHQTTQTFKGNTFSSHLLESNGTTLIVDIFEIGNNKNILRIPLLYPKEIENKMKLEKKNIKDNAMRWSKLYAAFRNAIEIIARNTTDFDGKALYSVLLFDPRNIYGLYLHKHRIVGLNVFMVPNHRDPTALAQFILNIACHELAHENTPNHGMIHEQKFEKYLRIVENKDKQTQEYILPRLSHIF